MQRRRSQYAPEFRRQMVELVRSGRSPESLGREFEPSAESIRNWVRQADLDEGRRDDGLTTAERKELSRLRRENRRLRQEREIWQKQPPGSLGRPTRYRRSLRVRESESGELSRVDDVPRARCLPERRLAVS